MHTTENKWLIHNNWHIIKTFMTEKGAKIAMARKYSHEPFASRYPNATVMSVEEFIKNEPMVETTNLMSGEKLMIRASEYGGCCDPGTGRYWSM